MTPLITFLGISIFSLATLFLFKHLEMRGSSFTFLPDAVQKKDRVIELTFRYILKRTQWWFTYRTKTLVHALTVGFFDTLEYVRERSRMRMISVLDTQGTASVFLKQVVEHKNNVRSAMSYSKVGRE